MGVGCRLRLAPRCRLTQLFTHSSNTSLMGVLVLVAMVEVGVVRMPVHQPDMAMEMGMRLARIDAGSMVVPMVRVVAVTMLVLHLLVKVVVLVALHEVQPQAGSHKCARSQ